MDCQIKLDSVVRDKLSGFEGVVVARTEWRTGRVRYCVESRELHQGKPIDPQWFDEDRLLGIDNVAAGNTSQPN